MAVNTYTRITKEKREEIYQRYLSGDSLTNMARCFGISTARIKQIVDDVSKAKSRPTLIDKLKEAYPDINSGTISGAINCVFRSDYYKSKALLYMSYKDFFYEFSRIKEEDLMRIRNMGSAKASFLKRAMTDYRHGTLCER